MIGEGKYWQAGLTSHATLMLSFYLTDLTFAPLLRVGRGGERPTPVLTGEPDGSTAAFLASIFFLGTCHK